jgi:hypothetical protein
MSLSVLQEFAAPGAAYRGKPFWAWNGTLEPEELRRQIRQMHQAGLGGFFMHARVGLGTAYLSDDWFACVDACLDEAKGLGMEAWLYDEDRWPSGAAGGLVTKHPRHRARELMLHTLHSPKELTWDRDTLAAFTATVEGSQARDVAPIAKGMTPKTLQPGQVILRFSVGVQGCSSWYNGFTYLDTLSHEAVQAFLDATHEVYRQRVGKEFGRLVPGIFTDEPNHGHKLGADNNTAAPRGLPWTGKLRNVFKQRYGYDLLPHLVELVYDVDGRPVSQARYHYHDCVTHLFVDAFSRQIGAWCDAHNLLFTGHVLEEDSLVRQANVVGSAMRFYEYMSAPGMDLLTEHWRSFNTAKQVSSAARQFGRQWRLTETYGCTGWDFPFAGHKALGDWQVALGINLRAQHLAWYTMQGEAKRDYPAAVFYQSPWWELYPKVEDYFARLHATLSRGAEVRDLLVVHPVESAWLLCKSGWMQDTATYALDGQFFALCDTLLAGHVDYDFGDEELLSRHARVRKTKGGAALTVGKATYRAVLVPPQITMRASTLKLLEQFKKAGGTVVFAGEPAAYVDAKASGAVAAFAATCARAPHDGPALVQAVEGTCRRLSISTPDGAEIGAALYLLREDAEAYYLFVCNTGEDFAADRRDISRDPMVRDRTLAFPAVVIRGLGDAAGMPLLLDPETGAVARAAATKTERGWEIRTSLPALGSRLFVLPKAAVETTAIPVASAPAVARTKKLGAKAWPIRLSEANVLVLDRARLRIGDGDEQAADEILRVDRAVRGALGVEPRGGAMVQPWARTPEKAPKTLPITLTYTFTADARPGGPLYLALEMPQTFRAALNGAPVAADAECGWWTDRSLRLLPLDPALVRPGANTLTLQCDYTAAHPGLEIIYLLGQFGAEARGTEVALTARPETLAIGDWTAQGLAFYAGSVAYETRITPTLAAGERLFVHVPAYRGTAVRVLVDGQPAGVIAWEPNEVEITALVGNGPSTLQIEVIGHRRNSHGPFHLNEKWPSWTGPAEFQPGPDQWYDGYQLVPCGLMAPPELVVKK